MVNNIIDPVTPTKPLLRPRRLELLTCSMARDLDIFALLAQSIDEHVDPEINHTVVVPGADLAMFRHFSTAQRTIIAQEDLLPVRLWKLPAVLRHLSFIKPGFRRPLYLTGQRELVRGWMLQQLLKIGMARSFDYEAIMHVDSDVCFFRAFRATEAFDGDRVRFFCAEGKTDNPMHLPWIESACHFLGLKVPERHHGHYVENCVLWSTEVVRAMVARIETVHGVPFHEVIFSASSMSEYYLYGLFAGAFSEGMRLTPEDISFCNSYWPEEERGAVDFDALRARLEPKHCALAIQSTHPIDLEARKEIYARAAREFART